MKFVSSHQNAVYINLSEEEVDEIHNYVDLEEMEVELYEGDNCLDLDEWQQIQFELAKLNHHNHTTYDLMKDLSALITRLKNEETPTTKQAEELATWEKELEKITKCPQRQDSTTDQLIDLYTIATRFGLYDAGDVIKNLIEKKKQPVAKAHDEVIQMKSYTEIMSEIETSERTLNNYREAFDAGEIDRLALKRALADHGSTVAALKWVIGENDRFD